jgi:hypothetical protein
MVIKSDIAQQRMGILLMTSVEFVHQLQKWGTAVAQAKVLKL